jgi:hypothetical protein
VTAPDTIPPGLVVSDGTAAAARVRTAAAVAAGRGATSPAPAIVLGCVAGPPAAGLPTAAWRAVLAPEVRLTHLAADPSRLAACAGDLPYALLAAGASAPRVIRLAQFLLARGDGPAHVLLCQCPDPVRLPAPLTCRLTVFAGPGEAGTAANWQAACGGEFTLRVVRDPRAVPPGGPVSADLALAVKEELGVWPN